jgi:hemolysin activation/secretion protein
VWLAGSQRRSRNWLDDIELVSRRRLATSVEQGVEFWRRGERCDLSLQAEGAQVQRMERDADFQSAAGGLPRSWRAEAGYGCRLGAGGWELSGQAWMQRVARPVDGSDLAQLGSRHTVRGMAAADARAGQGLAVLRHELQLPPWRLARGAVRLGTGIDWGRIHQPTDPGARGRELAAAVITLRWQHAPWAGELHAQHALTRPGPLAGAPPARRTQWQGGLRVGF